MRRLLDVEIDRRAKRVRAYNSIAMNAVET
jgi:hypothetical protein